ncbi:MULTISPECIES: CheR family methyltransferase [Clostridium]|jgi:chemotaxis protein methyltransferase CheR|uniref:protein-glutamate O-methyltransferase n=1 Tax=Clostridium saccharoperbutylacetonicum N1-4(HMT) TaxID=931276 RepID=M1MXG7_9CLOT|nr:MULTISPECIES: protein-glutamate O-methyltransferase CheR [Clostridium]AGF59231.1 chemotaxis protein methyltransferase CheR [Clostridium saccharoperbutylacetonicum N1-4(HMT)]AQR97900.1 chemotaxis protein methyltransferase cher2 [Clostridium saccharoperbutylacetonicum]NRT59982.1 chemotaxis protein methyltransferase CheR [Clostridium saccharoperbutylacetonicum]NSB23294.1 chemotaxis protein methyltransferase CheR [Clostridium saccharoperbutylacetonicum]NSB33792.1 chemotaxis protein methyltransf
MVTITEKEFKQLAKYIKDNYGINLKEEKKMLVIGRLHNVLAENNFESFSEYYDHIISDKTGKAVITLINKITTNHTYFMREKDHFDYLKEKVLPYMVNTIRDKDLRIWSAGCSSGEEAYTLAMILDEFFKENQLWWDKKLLATDISEKVLKMAKEGIYHKDQISSLPPAWKMEYLKKYDGENFIFTDKIKNEIIYRKFNLMDNVFPFKKKFQVIFCRNVMIYFDNETKNDVVRKFYNNLEYGGYLFIGHSESLSGDTMGFKYIMPSVYRKEL